MSAPRYSTGPSENTPLVTCQRCGAVLQRWFNREDGRGHYDDSRHPQHDRFHQAQDALATAIEALIDGLKP